MWEHSLSIQFSELPFSIHTFSTRSVTLTGGDTATIRVIGNGWRFVGPRDQSRWEAANRPELSHLEDGQVWRFRVGDYDFGSLQGTPLDRSRLASWSGDRESIDQVFDRALRELPEEQAAQEELEALGMLLGTAPLAPDARRSLWQITARVDGLRCLGVQRDRLGRAGLALAVDGPRYQVRTLIDPSAGRALEESRIAYGPLRFADASRGEYLLRTVFVVPSIESDPDLKSLPTEDRFEP